VGLYVGRELVAQQQQQRLHKHRHLRLQKHRGHAFALEVACDTEDCDTESQHGTLQAGRQVSERVTF
jgi:hypothetical protein